MKKINVYIALFVFFSTTIANWLRFDEGYHRISWKFFDSGAQGVWYSVCVNEAGSAINTTVAVHAMAGPWSSKQLRTLPGLCRWCATRDQAAFWRRATDRCSLQVHSPVGVVAVQVLISK